jgi:hypothetical protein
VRGPRGLDAVAARGRGQYLELPDQLQADLGDFADIVFVVDDKDASLFRGHAAPDQNGSSGRHDTAQQGEHASAYLVG